MSKLNDITQELDFYFARLHDLHICIYQSKNVTLHNWIWHNKMLTMMVNNLNFREMSVTFIF